MREPIGPFQSLLSQLLSAVAALVVIALGLRWAFALLMPLVPIVGAGIVLLVLGRLWYRRRF